MKGFTLIELLVVVVILGILTAIALPQYEKSVEKARATEGLLYAKALRDAIERHFVEFPDVNVTRPSQLADVKIPKGTYMGNSEYYIGKHFFLEIITNGVRVTRADGDGLGSKISAAGSGNQKYQITYTYTPATGSWSVSKTGCADKYQNTCNLFDL